MFHFIFPGQGSQHPGMGKFLFENFVEAKECFEEASDAIQFDLKKLCFEGPESDLALTENTQPAILTTSTATQRVLRKHFGIKPLATSGHSIGEYASLVLADSIAFASAVKAVRLRGQAMQTAVPIGQGGMVAVMGLEPSQVDLLCQTVNEKLKNGAIQAANYNCPGQIVISGSLTSLNFLREQIKIEDLFPEARRVKLIPLQVSAPFHCSLMKPAEEKMREVLMGMEFSDANIPVIQNLTAQVHTKALELRENLIRQISGSVKWMQSMETARKNGWTRCVEAGAGKVLSGLLKKIDADAFQVNNTNSIEDLKALEKTVLG